MCHNYRRVVKDRWRSLKGKEQKKNKTKKNEKAKGEIDSKSSNNSHCRGIQSAAVLLPLFQSKKGARMTLYVYEYLWGVGVPVCVCVCLPKEKVQKSINVRKRQFVATGERRSFGSRRWRSAAVGYQKNPFQQSASYVPLCIIFPVYKCLD